MKRILISTLPALVVSIGLVAALNSSPAAATEFTIEKPAKPQIEYSPFINRSFPRRVFWGDTHLHTTYSPDAGIIGNFNLGPDDAYRFARGEQVQANNGMQAKLVRPLDFLVVADHSEYQGLIPRIRGADPETVEERGREALVQLVQGRPGRPVQGVPGVRRGSWAITRAGFRFDKIARSTWDLMTEDRR